MPALLTVKDWLLLPAAAHHLSLAFDEEVHEADLLQAALDRQLTLSVLFEEGAFARLGRVVAADEFTDGDLPIWDDSGLRLDRTGFIVDVWDLSMCGDEQEVVRQRFLRLSGGKAALDMGLRGALLCKPDGTWAQVSAIEVHEHRGIRVTGVGKSQVPLIAVNHHPAQLPEEHLLCIRTTELLRFEVSLLSPQAGPVTGNEAPDPSDLPYELDCANLAFRAVWNGYGSQQETFKKRITRWLEEKCPELSQEARERIATVANPDKAPGRRRQEG